MPDKISGLSKIRENTNYQVIARQSDAMQVPIETSGGLDTDVTDKLRQLNDKLSQVARQIVAKTHDGAPGTPCCNDSTPSSQSVMMI